MIGTPRYMAPELFHVNENGESMPQVTKATDIWAFAMTVIEVRTPSSA